MFSSRKEIEELEALMRRVLNAQIEAQGEAQSALAPLQTSLTRAIDEAAHRLASGNDAHFEAQNSWLEKAFNGVLTLLLERMEADKTEILASIRTSSDNNREQIGALQDQFLERIGALEARNQALSAQIEGFQIEWRDSVAFEIRDESGHALGGWCDEIAERLKAFDKAEAMPRAFAHQLFQNLKKLRALHTDWDAARSGFESHLDELQRVLFAPDAGLTWNALTPHNSSPAQRKTLRALETALAEFRGALQERLRRETGIAPLEIVPLASRFDAGHHETSEFLEVPTGDAARHNLILGIERPGFQKTAPDGQFKLLQVARVRRYVLDPQLAPPQISGETAPQVSEAEENAPNEITGVAREEVAPLQGAPGEIEAAPGEIPMNDSTTREPRLEDPGAVKKPRVTGQL